MGLGKQQCAYVLSGMRLSALLPGPGTGALVGV